MWPQTLEDAARECLQAPGDTGIWDERCWNTHGPVAGVHRDSDALDRANWKAWQHELDEWKGGEDPDVFDGRFGHWAVGWVEHLFVRVYDEETGEITPAFTRAYEIAIALQDYPVLDEELLYEEEYQESVDTLTNCFDIPEDKAGEVLYWFSENEYEERADDITEESVDAACVALSIEKTR